MTVLTGIERAVINRGHERGAVGDLDAQRVAVGHGGDSEQGGDLRTGANVVVGLHHDHVTTHLGFQLVRGAQRDDLALVDDRDPVAPLRLLHVVRGHEDGQPRCPPDVTEVVPQPCPGLRVEALGGLVEEQDLGRVQDAAGDFEAALHPAREGHHDRVGTLRRSTIARTRSIRSAPLAARHSVHHGVEGEVLARRELIVQRGVLEDETDASAHVVGVAGDVDAGNEG